VSIACYRWSISECGCEHLARVHLRGRYNEHAFMPLIVAALEP